MSKKAITAGHICIDITPVFPKNYGDGMAIGDILRPGKLVQVDRPDIHTGGSVANTGLGMKLMGADVRLLGKIGCDEFGAMVKSALNQYDAGNGLVEVDGETTSYSIVVAVPGKDRIFLHCPGANDTFVKEDIPEEALEGAALFHFGYPPIMRKMYENDGEELVAIMRMMKERGIATSMDLAAVDPKSDAGRADWGKILANVLPYVDYFVPSFEELSFMLDREQYEALQEKAGGEDITKYLDPEKDIRPLAQKCLDLGAKAVMLKCGAPGMFLKTGSNMDQVGEKLELNAAAWNDFEKFQKSFHIDEVLSGTGAGDTSIAAFLTSILNGCGPEEALENAAAEGALCCTAYDALSGLLPLEEVRKRIEEGWR